MTGPGIKSDSSDSALLADVMSMTEIASMSLVQTG